MHRIAIFASGNGTNAGRIIEYFASPPTPLLTERGARDTPKIEVSLIVCNNLNAGVLRIAKENNIETLLIEKERFFRGDAYLPELKEKGIDFIALAGFLWKVPSSLISAYPRQIVNIHPALLPKYGGKGMYGNAVHQAVLDANDKESGITIHYVDDHYDNGDIIFQARCKLEKEDNAESLAARVHGLEHSYYPKVIESLLTGHPVST